MKGFSPERKEAILKNLLPPLNIPVAEVSTLEGISTASLYNWRKEARLGGAPEPKKKAVAVDTFVKCIYA